MALAPPNKPMERTGRPPAADRQYVGLPHDLRSAIGFRCMSHGVLPVSADQAGWRGASARRPAPTRVSTAAIAFASSTVTAEKKLSCTTSR